MIVVKTTANALIEIVVIAISSFSWVLVVDIYGLLVVTFLAFQIVVILALILLLVALILFKELLQNIVLFPGEHRRQLLRLPVVRRIVNRVLLLSVLDLVEDLVYA